MMEISMAAAEESACHKRKRSELEEEEEAIRILQERRPKVLRLWAEFLTKQLNTAEEKKEKGEVGEKEKEKEKETKANLILNTTTLL